MRNWVKWCILHNLSLVPYAVLILLLPAYLFIGMRGGVKEWIDEFRYLSRSIKPEMSNDSLDQEES